MQYSQQVIHLTDVYRALPPQTVHWGAALMNRRMPLLHGAYFSVGEKAKQLIVLFEVTRTFKEIAHKRKHFNTRHHPLPKVVVVVFDF